MKMAIGVVIAGALTVLVGSHYWRAGGKPRFRTAEVTRGDLSIDATATGTVEPVEIIEVGAQIIGSIKSFGPDLDQPGKMIDFCSRVKQGAKLAELDNLPYLAERDKAKVNLQLAKAELIRFQSKFKQSDQNLARAKGLRTTMRGAMSDADYENAVSDFEVAKAELAMAEAKVEQAKIAEKQAEINLGYTEILSPVDGLVISRKVNVGQTVVAGMNAPTLFLLAKDISHMLVRATVNEADIGSIRKGQKVSFTVSAFRDRKPFTGTVSQIRHDATLINSVVMYDVIVDVDNTDGTLLPYLTAKLNFQVDHRSNAIRIPDQALRWRPTWSQITPSARAELTAPDRDAVQKSIHNEEGAEDVELKVVTKSPTVWLIAEDGLVRPVSVRTGLSDGINTELTSGTLEPGDRVVTASVQEAEADFVKSFVERATNKN